MIDWIIGLKYNGLLGVLLYIVPASLCAYGYLIRIWVDYQKDVQYRREYPKTYTPNLTIGSLIGYALITVLPVANLWAALFDIAPDVFRTAFKYIRRVFNQPLVPPRKQSPDTNSTGQSS